MKFGLSPTEYQFLDQNLISRLKSKGHKVYIFGSRATGKNHKFSDVDILVEGTPNPESERMIRHIKDFFEDSNYPYKIDLVLTENLAESYRESVDSSKIEV